MKNKVQSSGSEVKSSIQSKQRTLSMDEVRGYIIGNTIKVEVHIANVITSYFNPNHPITFMRVILDNSMLSFGNKIKVLEYIGLIKKKDEKEAFYKLLNIRNAFAHAEHRIRFLPIEKTPSHSDAKSSVKSQDILTLFEKSHGALSDKDVDLLVREFDVVFEKCKSICLRQPARSFIEIRQHFEEKPKGTKKK